MNEEFERNRDDEDWEERREGRGKSVPECELDDFMRRLREGGPSHSSYYHYTQWGNFAKMMVPVADGDAKGKKVLLLTVASETNDKIEKHWGKNVYLGCFSYSRYEDVAMWMNYGKRSPDAIRIRFGGDEIRAWLDRRQRNPGLYKAIELKEGKGFRFERIPDDAVKSIELVDVAYVIPSRMTRGHLRGNVEYSREFYRVTERGSLDWSDAVYGGGDRIRKELSPFFKKRGWCYERETRIVVTLKKSIPNLKRLAIRFCGPLNDLKRRLESGEFERNLLRGPWYERQGGSTATVCGVGLGAVRGSDYAQEIEILTPCDSCKWRTAAEGRTSAPITEKSDRKSVKVLAVADIHLSDITTLDPAGSDLVLVAGDMQGHTCCGRHLLDWRVKQQVEWVTKTLIPWCRKYPKTEFVFVAGNGDDFALAHEKPFLKLPADGNVHYLQDAAITIHGLKIWGSPWVKPKNKRKDKPDEYKLFERSETDLKKIFGQMPEDVDVLVTHSTPTVEGTYIAGRPEEAMGCDALRDVILEKKPRVCVCGHIHAKEHHPAMLGETVVMNVSRIHGNERYAPAYRPRVFVMKRKEGKFVCEYDATDDMRVARKR